MTGALKYSKIQIEQSALVTNILNYYVDTFSTELSDSKLNDVLESLLLVVFFYYENNNKEIDESVIVIISILNKLFLLILGLQNK